MLACLKDGAQRFNELETLILNKGVRSKRLRMLKAQGLVTEILIGKDRTYKAYELTGKGKAVLEKLEEIEKIMK